MKTAIIKSNAQLTHNMGDLYLLESDRKILERPLINRGYIMALNRERNLYSYSFVESENPHEISELDRIIVERFRNIESIVPIPFDVEDMRGGNSLALENYLNQHFGNMLQIFKTEKGLSLFQRDSYNNLIKKKITRCQEKSIPTEIRNELLFYVFFGNIPLIDYVII